MSERYAAFISYSHAADGRLAPALQHALQRFTKPWYRRRALRVFRDETNLAVQPSLWGAIAGALEGSEYFVLLASPAAARSPWIQREVVYWLERRPLDSLLLVLTEGELRWDPDAGDFARSTTGPLPGYLAGRFHEEPRWLDLTWARDPREHLSLAHNRFQDAVAEIASVLHGRPKDDLVGVEVREHRRTIRLARAAVATLAALTLVAVLTALFAVQQRDVAQERRDQALRTQSLLLADLSRQQVRSGNATNGILLALESLPGVGGERPYVAQAEAALHDALVHHRERLVISLPGADAQPVTVHAWSPHGRWLLVSSNGLASLRDAASGASGPALARRHGRGFDPDRPMSADNVAGAVLSGAFDPAGDRIATTSNTGTAFLWNARTGDLVATLEGHANWSRSVRFSADGTRLATASNDATARLWDARSGQALHVLRHRAEVWSARFSGDGARLLTASSDRTARIWDVPTGNPIAVLEGHTKGLSAAEFDHDAQRVVTGSWDGTARLWDARSGTALATLIAHDSGVSAVAVSPDGRLLATGSMAGEAQLWDARTGTLVRRLDGHDKEILAVAFDPCNRHLVTASEDGDVRLWNARTGALDDVLQGHAREFLSRVSFALSPDCDAVASAARDGTVRVWSLRAGRPLATLPRRGATNVAAADLSPAAGLAATAGGGNEVQVWELATGKPVAELRGHTGPVNQVVFSPDGTRVATASDDRSARIREPRTGTLRALLHGHDAELWGAAFDGDGARVVTWAWDHTARVWDAGTGALLHVLRGHRDFLYHAAFSRQGRRILTASNDGTVRVFDAASGREVAAHSHGEETAVRVAAFSPAADSVASGAQSGSLHVWDTESGALRVALQGVEFPVLDIDWSPDGRLLGVAVQDGTARIFDARTGAQRAALAHGSWVRMVRFTANGRRLITAQDRPVVRVWDVASTLPVAILADEQSTANNAWLQALSPDQRFALTRNGDGSASIWRIFPSTTELIAHARAVAPRRLRADERSQFYLPPAEQPAR